MEQLYEDLKDDEIIVGRLKEANERYTAFLGAIDRNFPRLKMVPGLNSLVAAIVALIAVR